MFNDGVSIIAIMTHQYFVQQIGVAVMRQFAKQPRKSTTETSLYFAKQLHNGWGVGHAKCNDGTLLLVSIEDRTVSISTGTEVKERLDEDVIVQSIIPFMKREQYAVGVYEGVGLIGKGLRGHDKAPLVAMGILVIVAGVLL